MKSNIYNLVTIEDGASDTAGIIKVISDMASGRLTCDLSLLNYYCEIPVSYAATINKVEADSVDLTVNEHQALIIKHDHSTLLKSKHFHNGLGVHCFAAHVSVPKKTVILHNFAYAQIRAERREAVRVKVRGTYPVTFSYEGGSIEGSMVDISGSGISVNTKLVPTADTDQEGLLKFTLNGKHLSVEGTFIRSDNGADGNISVFKMQPDWSNENVIGLFIYHQQVDIILELKDGFVVD